MRKHQSRADSPNADRSPEDKGWHQQLSGLFFVNVTTALSGVMGLWLYSRLMPSHEFGRYVLGQALQMMAQWFLFGWAIYGALRYASRYEMENRLQALVTTGLIVIAAISIVFFGVVEFGGNRLPERYSEYESLITGLTLACISRSTALFLLEIHRGLLSYSRYTLLESTQAVLTPIFGALWCIHSGGSATSAFWGIASANVLIVLMDVLWILPRLNPRHCKMPVIAELWRFGSPISSAIFLNQCLGNLDRFILTTFLGEAAVGIYGASVMLAERPLSIIFNWIGSASASIGFDALNRKQTDQARRALERAAGSIAFFAWPLAFGLLATSNVLPSVIVGGEISDAVQKLLPIVVLASLFKNYHDHHFAQFFQFIDRTRILLIFRVSIIFISLLMNVLLIPRLGIWGAPLSSLIAIGIAITLQLPILIRCFPIHPPWQDMIKCLVACLAMWMVVISLPEQRTLGGLAFMVVSGMATYAVACLIANPAEIRSRIFGYGV